MLDGRRSGKLPAVARVPAAAGNNRSLVSFFVFGRVERVGLNAFLAPSTTKAGWTFSARWGQRAPPGSTATGLRVFISVCSVWSVDPAAIPVVCAVIEREGRVLVAQRPAHKHLPLKWEFPGGKVEPGETAEAAIIREIREELGCDLLIARALPRFTHAYAVVIEMIPFVCTLAPTSPPPHAHEHVALAWVTLAELRAYDLAAADWPVIDALVV